MARLISALIVLSALGLVGFSVFEGRRFVATDILPGEDAPAPPPARSGTDWSADWAPRIRSVDSATAQDVHASLLMKAVTLYPCVGRIMVSVGDHKEKDKDPRHADPSTILTMEARGPSDWIVRVQATGEQLIWREGAQIEGTLPWESRPYRAESRARTDGGPLSLPPDLITPEYLVGIDDTRKTAEFAYWAQEGPLRSLQVSVEMETGAIRVIRAAYQRHTGEGGAASTPFVITARVISIGPLAGTSATRRSSPVVPQPSESRPGAVRLLPLRRDPVTPR